jgi:hypothetical protein
MNPAKKTRLEKAGFRVGSTTEFLNFSRRLEDYYDLQAVKRAQKCGVYHPYEQVRRELRS